MGDGSMIFLPRGVSVRQNVNPARINLPEAMEKLRVGSFTGYLRFDAPSGAGIIIFESGKLVSALFVGTDEQRQIAYDAISKIFEVAIAGEAILNIYRLSDDLAMGLHALLHGTYVRRGEDLKTVDIDALLQEIKDEQFNGCLRVYADNQTVLIFYNVGSAMGFFHEGAAALRFDADLSKSVARLPGARLDLLETALVEDLVLADLMASADLKPIWQRIRNEVLHERSKREEEAIRSREGELEVSRKQLLSELKAHASEHAGKLGVAQVEKAFSVIGPEMRKEEIEQFYVTVERLATMVAPPLKVREMIQAMKKQFN